MNFGAFIETIKQSTDYADQIVHVERAAKREAQYGELSEPLPPELADALQKSGISRLYTHQVDAIEVLRAGKNVVIETGTASGKTLCYNIPVIEELIKHPESSALYIFPMKALAQDQLRVMKRLSEASAGSGDPTSVGIGSAVRPGTYDGDMSSHHKRKVRSSANVILTNPDMLHVGILPYHTKWNRFFANLRFVVIDEVHTYRGIFGSNVANVIRRLNRICKYYGSSPQFVCCSATIANPLELTESLTGHKMELIKNDGSPRGARYFVLWNPPFIADDRMLRRSRRYRYFGRINFQPFITGDRMSRRSSNVEGQRLMAELIRNGVQTITFTRARVVAELIYRYCREEFLKKGETDLAESIRSYRAGYLPEDRREIERMLFSGELMGVTSTTALELGIDVGDLDACIIVGFPGTIASMLQQSGRAGRGSEQALTVLIPYNDPIEQYLIRNSDYLFGQSPENAVIDPDNPYVLDHHLRCATYEIPLTDEDEEIFGPYMNPILELLENYGTVRNFDGKWYWATGEYPAGEVSLRLISDDTYVIMDAARGNAIMGSVDSISGLETVYPGAVYMHEGDTYFVQKLDIEQKTAYVEESRVDYYTQPILDQSIVVKDVRNEKLGVGGCQICLGEVEVTWRTAAFRKVKFYTAETIGYTDLDLPEQHLETVAMWIVPPKHLIDDIKSEGGKPINGMAGIRNVLMAVLPLVAMCDRQDISGQVESKNVGSPAIFLYDRYPGGLGFSEKGYQMAEEMMQKAYKLIEECPCEDGCPSCVAQTNVRAPIQHDPDSWAAGWNMPDKQSALMLLRRMRS
jgi:DEAD/DEAH box helicase domain-containing protein